MRVTLAQALGSLDTTTQLLEEKDEDSETERITSYTQVLFIFIVFRLNSVNSRRITQFKCHSRKRSLLAWQVRQDHCDDRITGCKGEIVWPATVIQGMGKWQ